MRNHVVCAIAGCVLGSCALVVPAIAGGLAEESKIITIILRSDAKYSPVALGEMSREASAILRKSGIQLVTRTSSAAGETFDESIVVVTLRGECDMDRRAGTPYPSRSGSSRNDPKISDFKGSALGWTHSSDGVVLPFSELACDNIREAVSGAMPVNAASRANFFLGRAMGRVLAHELYHVVAATFEHGHGGVAQPGLTPADLVAGRLELDTDDADAIRAGRQ
jgi:hypothetical protein